MQTPSREATSSTILFGDKNGAQADDARCRDEEPASDDQAAFRYYGYAVSKICARCRRQAGKTKGRLYGVRFPSQRKSQTGRRNSRFRRADAVGLLAPKAAAVRGTFGPMPFKLIYHISDVVNIRY